MNTQLKTPATFDTFLQANTHLNDPATLEGAAALIDKLAPLLQGRRLHNVVDLLSAVADVMDMADDAMVQKMMHGYEGLAAGAFNAANTLRFSAAQAGAEARPPTLWQAMRRLNRDEDARRGLAMVLAMLTLLGRQARQGATELPED